MSGPALNRRAFLGTASALAAAAGLSGRAAERPAVTNPRATSGDSAHEPNWAERLTVTVGPKDADLVGTSEKVLQAAVDYVVRFGGGTVKILPGTYELRNAVYLPSGIRILGSGADSILKKNAQVKTTLTDDSNWYEQEITVEDAGGFNVGDGIAIQVTDPHNGGPDVLKRTLVARDGNRFKLDKPLRENLWLVGKPNISNLFPLLTSEYTADVTIENLMLDGNRENNENFNGNYGGCIFLQDCNRYTFRNVEARNYNGDGFSWQICHDVVVENCHSHDNADLGLHPGSGSQRPVMRGNKIERCSIGIFFCWGVKYGLAENNTIDECANQGISIGHCDTDNLVCNNEIRRSGQVGILFRDENRGRDFWPHRNRIEHNRVIDSGPDDGVAIDIRGKTGAIVLHENEIRETRQPMSRTAVKIGPEAGEVTLQDNVIAGFATEIADERQS